MQNPLQITLHGIGQSEPLVEAIRQRVDKLERHHEHIISCRVVLELAGRHRRHGKQFAVHIDLKVPGAQIDVTREHDEDIAIAMREAFVVARRKLTEYMRGLRGRTKHHAQTLWGRIENLDPDARFGFILTDDGRQFYFSDENVVTPPFEHLWVGALVHFIEDAGGQGPQAKRVSVRSDS
jgi:ribosome-associated translation inhibitor RaiA/cold shock CspA family protein